MLYWDSTEQDNTSTPKFYDLRRLLERAIHLRIRNLPLVSILCDRNRKHKLTLVMATLTGPKCVLL